VLSRQYEGGADLSGGQWQRMALARALFAVEGGSRVLVLDEPTANLDPATEHELLATLYASAPGRATLAITHRLVHMERMDEILVLDKGTIVERGTHAQLIHSNDLYARMVGVQERMLAGR
jgi:ATP-binding cassette subfamily B protein